MKNKGIGVLFLLLIGTFFISFSYFFQLQHLPLSVFELQNQYTIQLEKKLKDLLEPAVGVGNVRASVQAEIAHKDIVQKHYNPFTMTETTVHQKGPVLEKQSVSVLINERDKEKISIYKNLVEAAVGYNTERGDSLSIKGMPFVRVPLWTLGLTPLSLIRIGVGLILLILIGMIFLIKDLKKCTLRQEVYFPDRNLWRKVEEISAPQLASFFKENRPEISAFILYFLPQQKSDEIIEYFPQKYMDQVIPHLDYIERLSSQDRLSLLQETEIYLNKMLQNINNSFGKDTFDSLAKWSDKDLQNLLCYISQKDLIKALQQASVSVQLVLSRNIPPVLWQNLIQQVQKASFSESEILQAQKKIMRLAQLIKENG